MLNQEPSSESDEPAIESLLAGFSPKENAIDRERLMFLAGYEAAKHEFEKVSTDVRSANRRWKFLAFVSSAAAAVLAMFLLSPFPTSVIANRNDSAPASTGVETKPIEIPKVEGVPEKSTVVAMLAVDEKRSPPVQVGPEDGCLHLRNQVLREGDFAFLDMSVVRGGGVSRPPATQRQLFLELPVEVRETLAPTDKRSHLQGSSRLGERS